MDGPSKTRNVSRRLVELSAARPPIHSFNRQFLRLLLDATRASAATLWLLQGSELLLAEEIEESVGAIRDLRLSQKDQQTALRRAFEDGSVVVLEDGSREFDPLAQAQDSSRRVVFLPVVGLRANLGSIRLIFEPMPEDAVSGNVLLAEAIAGYYALYTAERVLELQDQQRQDIDRLSKAILELQHYTFSRRLPEVAVNSALEVVPNLDRVILLAADKNGDLEVGAASSVSQVNRKSAWARLLRDLGSLVLQHGEPVHFFAAVTDPADIEDPELREHVNSYLVMTEARSVLIYPLQFADVKPGVILFESFQAQPPTNFERILCTIFATHVGSALANHIQFTRIPFARFFARDLDDAPQGPARGRSRAAALTKAALVAAVIGAVAWFLCLHKVPDTVGAPCFVVPHVSRVITARVPGEIREVAFKQGDTAEKSQTLIKQKSDQVELQLSKALENARGIKVNISRLRGQAEKATGADNRGQSLAQMLAAQHALAAEQHEIQILRQQLRDHTLAAPITGTIIAPENPQEMVGMVVRAGEPLCEIGQIRDRIRIRIAVPEADAPRVARGQKVEITLEPLVAKEVLEGTIRHIASRSMTYKNTNVFMAAVVVHNRTAPRAPGQQGHEYLIKPGMTGKARINIEQVSSYISIYARALKRKLQYWLF